MQSDIAPSVGGQASVASSSNPSKAKSSRSTSVSRVIDDEPSGTMRITREPSPDPKPKKGKATKKSAKSTFSAKVDSGRVSPSNSVAISETRESTIAVNTQEDEEAPAKAAGKKKTSKKKAKKSKAPSVRVDNTDDERMDVDPEPVLNDPDATPMPPSRITMDSLGGWESFQAANLELEELARQLHIEGEFAAIGKKPSGSSKQTARAKPSSGKRVPQAAEKPPPDLWAWREREKSVGAKSVVTEMTEEEEVEKSLTGDDFEDEMGERENDEEPVPSPPTSRAPSRTSRAHSTSASTTVSSKTKAKVREMKESDKSRAAPTDSRMRVLKDEEMADGETPKASGIKGASTGVRPGPVVPSKPPLPFPSFDSDANGSNPFLVSRTVGGTGGSKSGIDALMAQLDAPLIMRDVDSRALTEEEREMTLEEWIRYNVEQRKELIRKEGRKWIDTFLEGAEGVREKIRAM